MTTEHKICGAYAEYKELLGTGPDWNGCVRETGCAVTLRVDVSGEWPDGGSLYGGSNRRAGEWFLGLSNASDSQSLRIPKKDRAKVAKFLRRFADRLDPPAKVDGSVPR